MRLILQPQGIVEALVAGLDERDVRVLPDVVTALAKLKPEGWVERIAELASHTDPVVRTGVVEALEEAEGLSDPVGVFQTAWTASRRDTITDAKTATLRVLARHLDLFEVKKIFVEALNDPDWLVRTQAADLSRLMGKRGEALRIARVETGRPAAFYSALEGWSRSVSPSASLETDLGPVRIELWARDAPLAVHNFITLAEADFFVGLSFHRVVPNFVTQGGCPHAFSEVDCSSIC